MFILLIYVIQAVPLLHEVVRLAPNVSDGYYLLGLIHDSLGDRKKAFNFHMIAAFFSRKDASLWKKLVAWSIEMGDVALVKHCLSKAIIADPDDVGLKFDGALLYFKAGEFLKAAELYEQIIGLSPENVEARKMAAKVTIEGFFVSLTFAYNRQNLIVSQQALCYFLDICEITLLSLGSYTYLTSLSKTQMMLLFWSPN